MADLNNTLRITRIVVFATTSVFGLIVIILGGLVTNFSTNNLGIFYDYAALGIATGLLTVLTLPVMLALSMVRKGAFTSMIALEIGWTWFLWIMWLAVGGNSAAGVAVFFFGSCSAFAPCSESTGIIALGFLSWIMMLVYCSLLSTLTFRQHLRGNTGIWTKDVTEADFTAVGGNNPQIVYDNKAAYPNQYPPTGTPIVPQQTPGSYTQAGVPYQPGTPQAPGLYNQSHGATGSFTHPQGQTGSNPYPQV